MASTGSNSSVQEADVAASRADIVVALTSYNDVHTIGAVARALRDGLARHFASSAARFVLADAGSTDGTREAAREAVGPSALVEVEYQRGRELGRAAVSRSPRPRRGVARHSGDGAAARAPRPARSSTRAFMTVEPDWIERLIAPVLTDGFDYVSPLLRPARQRRRRHQGHRVPDVPGALRRAAAPAGRRRVRLFGASGGPYPGSGLLGREHAQVGIDLWLAPPPCAGSSASARRCSASAGRRARGARRI